MADLAKEWESAVPLTEWDEAEPLEWNRPTFCPSGRTWSSVPRKRYPIYHRLRLDWVRGLLSLCSIPCRRWRVYLALPWWLGISPEEAPAWEATKQFFANRYGGEEELKNTIATDPVGFLTDISTVLTGGGSLAAGRPDGG